MSTHQWLLDHGLMPRPRMSSYVQKTFEIALIEAGKATREALVERERRSTAESELRGKVRDIEAAMEEAEKCKRLANDERVLRESAAAKYRQQSVALEDMARIFAGWIPICGSLADSSATASIPSSP